VAVFALCDANNFYCSCERVFNPKLKGVPIVVLSNNDGCCISRSAEAKAIGIKMGDPWHKISKWAEAAGTRKFSSNYELYGDMSRRIYEVLSRYAPNVEPYSIDEMFLDLTGLPGDMLEHGRIIRQAVLQETKIPTCVGIGETKTKAKLANYLAKQRHEYKGVCDLRDPRFVELVYPTIDVCEVWGIGKAATDKLRAQGVASVADLVRMSLKQVREMLTVTGTRVVAELRGVSCLPLTLVAPQRKGTAVTRTFGVFVTRQDELAEAMSSFATRAAEKLREHGLIAGSMSVFVQTNKFNGDPYYANSVAFDIEPTSDTFAMIENALRGMRAIWRDGYRYWKAGVMLNDLSPEDEYRETLFATRPKAHSDRLMVALDKINGRYGTGSIRPAVNGLEKRWRAQSRFHSPRYTTEVTELMNAKVLATFEGKGVGDFLNNIDQ